METFSIREPIHTEGAAIAEAAKELDDLRARWLNPPEWTTTEILDFPGSTDGPWARYIDPATVRPYPTDVGWAERESAGDACRSLPRSAATPLSAPPPPASPTNSPHSGPLSRQEGAAAGIGAVRWPRLVPKDPHCAASLKTRTLTNLYNQRPEWLSLAHKKLDQAVFAAYGWDPGMSDEQLLERLLALNLQRANA